MQAAGQGVVQLAPRLAARDIRVCQDDDAAEAGSGGAELLHHLLAASCGGSAQHIHRCAWHSPPHSSHVVHALHHNQVGGLPRLLMLGLLGLLPCSRRWLLALLLLRSRGLPHLLPTLQWLC